MRQEDEFGYQCDILAALNYIRNVSIEVDNLLGASSNPLFYFLMATRQHLNPPVDFVKEVDINHRRAELPEKQQFVQLKVKFIAQELVQDQ